MVSPLAGVRVCDVSQNLAGPFCCQILGDLGADVIKVEPPGGDPARAWGPPFWGSASTLFLSVNRNRRSIVLDLKSEAGRSILHRIAGTADVFVHSSRAGVPERLGFDYASIRRVREDVIYAAVSAYGERGPLKDDPGYDPLMQAFAGIMSVTGHPGGPPVRVGGSVVDFGTGMWAAIGILSALRTRDRTGRGGRLDAALLDTALGWISNHLMAYLATGQVPGRMGSGFPAIVPYQAFATADGNIMIAAGSDAIFGRLCEALELRELARDPRFRTNPLRVANRDELVRTLEAVTRKLDTEEILERTRRHAVPASPIHDVSDVAAHPQVAASEMLVPAEHPEASDYRDVALPLRVDGERPRGSLPPSAAGEHTLEILRALGFTEAETARLVEDGVIEVSPAARGTARADSGGS